MRLTAEEIDRALMHVCERENSSPFTSSFAYLVSTGGKRLRPLLGLGFALDIGSVDTALACLQVVPLELVHMATLVHDDLPLLDNDDYRRGMLTVHKQFDEITAFLLADWLFGKASVVLAAFWKSESTYRAVSSVLSQAMATVAEGQLLDLRQVDTLEMLIKVHDRKTGALFQAAVEFGALMHGAFYLETYPISRVGLLIGRWFQLLDDLADRKDSMRLKGRPVSSDHRNGKLYQITIAEAELRRCIASCYLEIDETLTSMHDISPARWQRTRELLSAIKGVVE